MILFEILKEINNYKSNVDFFISLNDMIQLFFKLK